jgi:hypothetical protein
MFEKRFLVKIVHVNIGNKHEHYTKKNHIKIWLVLVFFSIHVIYKSGFTVLTDFDTNKSKIHVVTNQKVFKIISANIFHKPARLLVIHKLNMLYDDDDDESVLVIVRKMMMY